MRERIYASSGNVRGCPGRQREMHKSDPGEHNVWLPISRVFAVLLVRPLKKNKETRFEKVLQKSSETVL